VPVRETLPETVRFEDTVAFPEMVISEVIVLAERVFISTLLTLITAFLTFKVLSGDSIDI
jgi:hypothetical protein